MRIFFMGSLPTFDYEEDREVSEQEQFFVRACNDLGVEAARRGHEVILSDDHTASVDAHVMSGLVSYVDAHPDATVDVTLNRSEGSPRVFDQTPAQISVQRNFHPEVDKQVHGTGSLIPNLASLDASDVAILMGGGISTQLIGSIGADRDPSVLAIPSFGGAASELYGRLKVAYKARVGPRHPGLGALNSIWTERSAADLIDLAEALCSDVPTVEPHSYFLSYHWSSSSAEADHVEALLRRNGRQVYRDETAFGAGRDLTNEIKSIIGRADTFIALHREAYANSDWCPGELKYATKQRGLSDKPVRVVLLAVEDPGFTEDAIMGGNSLWMVADQRESRELSVRKIMEQES